jgi:adenylate cyclase class 2
MSIEVELKAWLSSHAATRAAIEAAGAEYKGETEKRDHYYGPAGRAARDVDFEKDPIFRIRSEGAKTVVATKRREIDDGVEVNREIEFEVADAASFREFAQAIGFRPFIVKRKKTRKYVLGRASVDLHRVDPLGDFIEIEILVEDEADVKEAQAEVRGLLERFGVPKEKIEPRLYIDLLRKMGVGRPDRGE